MYNSLAKAQHGVCTKSQLPWDYEERIGLLKKELNAIISDSHPGFLKKAKSKLLSGMLHDDFPIVTEIRRITRRTTLEASKPNEELYEEGRSIVTNFAQRIIAHVDKESLTGLIKLANNSGRKYGYLCRTRYRSIGTGRMNSAQKLPSLKTKP